jgi:hypothetical protein
MAAVRGIDGMDAEIGSIERVDEGDADEAASAA